MRANALSKKYNWESHYRVFKIIYYYTFSVSIPFGFSKLLNNFKVFISFLSQTTQFLTEKYLTKQEQFEEYDFEYSIECDNHFFCDCNFDNPISFWNYRTENNTVDIRSSINGIIELDFRQKNSEERDMPYKIKITAKPDRTFEVPVSDGYQLYSAILNRISKSDPQVSTLIHDSNNSSLSVSSLEGIFKNCPLKGYKILEQINKYKFNIGIILEDESRLYQAIAHSLIFDGGKIDLLNGSLIVVELKDTNESFIEIAKSSEKFNRPLIEFNFKTTTCIQYQNSSVTEMFPHRSAVYLSLLSKWNHSCPDNLELTITNDEISRYIIEKPITESYCTHSVMVSTVHDEKSNTVKPIFRQGFKGKCIYTFTQDAPRHIQDIILTLSKFAEYSGVGSSVSRGCGCVNVIIKEVDK